MNELILIKKPDFRTSQNRLNELARQATAMIQSATTVRLYARQLELFLNWVFESSNELESTKPLTRELVADYLTRQRAAGKTPSSLRLTKAAILRLATEAEARGLISERDLAGIRKIELPKSRGAKLGNWLTFESAKRLRDLPDKTTIAGKRDRAVLAILLGCGLRREEAASLTWNQYQLRDGRMIFVDIVGKGNKLRSVPVAPWAADELNIWRAEIARLDPSYDSREERCYVLRRIKRDWQVVRQPPPGEKSISGPDLVTSPILGNALTAMGVWWIVKGYGEKLGIDLRPHDLRRTLASLLDEKGVQLRQIQLTLGHANLRTTERYLGQLKIALGQAGVDQIDL